MELLRGKISDRPTDHQRMVGLTHKVECTHLDCTEMFSNFHTLTSFPYDVDRVPFDTSLWLLTLDGVAMAVSKADVRAKQRQ